MKRQNLTPEEVARHHADTVERCHALERALVRTLVVVDFDTETRSSTQLRPVLDAGWQLVDADGAIRARHIARAQQEEGLDGRA